MRYVCWAVTLSAMLMATARGADKPRSDFDFRAWQHLPVQEGGRFKPLDTLAWETMRTLANRATVAHPETGEDLSATAAYVAMLLERDATSRTKPADPHAMFGGGPHTDYFARHEADPWDKAPLLRVDDLDLRAMLGIPVDEKYISPQTLNEVLIKDPGSGTKVRFVDWAGRLAGSPPQELSSLQKKAVELADKLWAYQDHRSGRRLRLLPVDGSDDREWISIDRLQQTKWSDANDPAGRIREVKRHFEQAREAYRAGDAEAFNTASAAMLAAVGESGPRLGTYPERAAIDLEVAYNRFVPFRFAWILTLTACAVSLLSMGWRRRWIYVLGLTTMAAGLVAMFVGFGMRMAISGRAPVTNMYESVIYLGLGVAVFGLIFEIVSRKRYVLAAAAAISTIALILADNCPAVLDPSMRPLPPVLRNNFWLITHVMTITLSYAAFALALGIGNVTLGYFLVGSQDRQAIRSQSGFTYRVLQIGVLLLAIGTVLGGVWADYSWGRFWGWDPKEVWALITLLCYVAVLHGRYVGWVGTRGLAALSVVCFSLVVMAWYGVNYVLGTGLHSYGFGGGGQAYVLTAILAQLLFVGLCLVVSIGRAASSPKPSAAESASNDGPHTGLPRLVTDETLNEVA